MKSLNALSIVTGNASSVTIKKLKQTIKNLEQTLLNVKHHYETFACEDFIPVNPYSHDHKGCCVCGKLGIIDVNTTMGMYSACEICHERWIFKGVCIYDSVSDQFGYVK